MNGGTRLVQALFDRCRETWFRSPASAALVFVWLLPCGLIAGCGGEPLPEFGQVSGTVRVKGKPTSQLSVRFLPEPSEGKETPASASGITDQSGRYELKYYFKGQEGPGAAVGMNRVVVEDTRLGAIQQGQPIPPQLFSLDYTSPVTTPLRFEVKPGEQTIDIDLTQ